MRQSSARAAFHRDRTLLDRVRALRDERETCRRGPSRTLNVFNESSEAITLWITDAHRRIKDLLDRKSTRLNSSHMPKSRMPSSA